MRREGGGGEGEGVGTHGIIVALIDRDFECGVVRLAGTLKLNREGQSDTTV